MHGQKHRWPRPRTCLGTKQISVRRPQLSGTEVAGNENEKVDLVPGGNGELPKAFGQGEKFKLMFGGN